MPQKGQGGLLGSGFDRSCLVRGRRLGFWELYGSWAFGDGGAALVWRHHSRGRHYSTLSMSGWIIIGLVIGYLGIRDWVRQVWPDSSHIFPFSSHTVLVRENISQILENKTKGCSTSQLSQPSCQQISLVHVGNPSNSSVLAVGRVVTVQC